MPGKSGRSTSRTSPMLCRTRPEAAALPSTVPVTPLSHLRSRGAVGGGLVALEEHEAVLADLDLVGVLEHDRVDAVAVDVGAVQAARVGDDEGVALAGERRVTTGDGH